MSPFSRLALFREQNAFEITQVVFSKTLLLLMAEYFPLYRCTVVGVLTNLLVEL